MLRAKLKRLKDRIMKVICNADIACGFFWGSTFSALVCVVMLLIAENYL